MTAALEQNHAVLFVDAEVGESTSLHASRCNSCERVAFPQRQLCPACLGETRALLLVGPARLRVHTGVLAQPPGSRVEAPYDVGVAEFGDGICVIGLMDGPAQRGDLVQPVVVEPYPSGRTFALRRTTTGATRGDEDKP